MNEFNFNLTNEFNFNLTSLPCIEATDRAGGGFGARLLSAALDAQL